MAPPEVVSTTPFPPVPAVKERPILFSGPMVRALLDGTKTQTRRIVALPRSRGSFVLEDHGDGWWPYQSDDGESSLCDDGMEHPCTCPYGRPGDQLWVRETHAPQADCWGAWERATQGAGGEPPILHFAADFRPFQNDRGQTVYKPFIEKWRPAIHMPRWASRIDLEVTSVRVERLQDISDEDARAEGITAHRKGGWHWEQPPAGIEGTNHFGFATARDAFGALWESINGAGSWAANPWLWVVEFRRIRP